MMNKECQTIETQIGDDGDNQSMQFYESSRGNTMRGDPEHKRKSANEEFFLMALLSYKMNH